MAADLEFVLDAVIGFLRSPIWNTPVPTFIEKNCVVFDRDEENYEEYKEIHENYKHLVESLLFSFLKDIGITEKQFTDACKETGSNPQFNDIQKNVLEQIWAAENYEIFKRLMIQKNIELQLQALQLIQQHSNKKPTSSVQPQIEEEDEIMKEVLRLSKEEYDKQTQLEKKVEEDFNNMLTESFEDHEELKMLAARERQELDKAIKTCAVMDSHPESKPKSKEEDVLKTSEKEINSASIIVTDCKNHDPSPKAAKASPASSVLAAIKTTSKSQETKSKGADLPPLLGITKSKTPADAAANWLNDAKAEASASSEFTKQAPETSEDEIKRRTEYLRQQRDKLLKMKKHQREKNLQKFTEDQPKARPMSARAARRATVGEQATFEPAPVGKPDEKKLAMRRALADVLKREVIEKQ